MLSEKWIKDTIETEANFIGGIMARNEYFDLIELTHEDFYEDLHIEIFREIEGLVSESLAITVLSIKARLPYDEWEGLNVGQYLIDLAASSTVNHLTLSTYEKTIKEASNKVKLLSLGECVSNHEGNSTEIIDDLEKGLADIHRGVSGKSKSMNEMIDQSIDVIQDIANGKQYGVSTGLINLDQILGGLFAQEFIVLAGRPAMGKSTLATQIALNIARQQYGVIFFNLEMSFQDQVNRIYCEMLFHEGEFNLFYNKIRRGVSQDEMESICRSAHDLKKLPIILDDKPSLSLIALKTRSRAYIRRLSNQGYDVKTIVIDYLQLMSAGSKYRGQRVNEVSEITRGLKKLAKELNVNIIALSQLSRAVENRENKRPILADLRESGSIEQDADVVMYTYRHEYYLSKEEPEDPAKLAEWQLKMEDCRGVMEMILAKQRNGETGIVKAACEMGAAKVYNLRK